MGYGPYTSNWFDVYSGRTAVANLSGELCEIGDEEKYERDEDPDCYEMSGDAMKKLYEDVAAEIDTVFNPVSKFKSVELLSHHIYEDGDTEYRILLAKEPDGQWLVTYYYNHPF